MLAMLRKPYPSQEYHCLPLWMMNFKGVPELCEMKGVKAKWASAPDTGVWEGGKGFVQEWLDLGYALTKYGSCPDQHRERARNCGGGSSFLQ